MISKTLLLLASGAAFAAAGSVADYDYKYAQNLHQWDPTAPKKHLGPSPYHHHSSGPSQFHHNPSTGTKSSPHPSAEVTRIVVGTPSASIGRPATDNNVPATSDVSLGVGRDNDGHSTQSASLERQNPKVTSVPEGHHSQGEYTPGKNNGHLGPSASKDWNHPGASQGHHHPPGPSQKHTSNKDKEHSWNTPSKMHYNNHNNNDSADWSKHNPKMHHGTSANDYNPYVVTDEHGAMVPVQTAEVDRNPAKVPSGDDSAKPPVGWGASASARARQAEKEKQKYEGLYALYGQAAADACGLDEQMPGAEITACPVENGIGWDCLNLASTLESCGGCMSIGEGQDCTLIKGADTVGCIHGKCVIGSCESGFYLDSEKGACVAN